MSDSTASVTDVRFAPRQHGLDLTLVRPPRRSNRPDELGELKAFLDKEKMLPV